MAPGKNETIRECHWVPQSHEYMVCTFQVAGRDQHGLTVYSYNSKDGSYAVTSIVTPGAKPLSAATLTIHGNLWTSVTTVEIGGKPRQIRSTADRSSAAAASVKIESSDDGGAHWTLTATSTEHKAGN